MLPNSTVRNFTDPDEYQQSLRGVDVRLSVTAPGAFAADLTRVDLHTLWIQRARLSLPSVTHSTVHKDRTMVFFLLDADQPPIVNSGIEVTAADIIRYQSESSHHYRTLTSYHCGGMSMSPADFAAATRALVGRELTAPPTNSLVRPPPDLMARLRTLHKAAADLATDAPDILAHPEVAKAIELELVLVLAAALAEGVPVTTVRESRIPVMRRFEELLEGREGQPVYVSEICAEIGVSERALRMHCQDNLGMSPHQYLWLRRMNLARRALTRADGGSTTVTSIAIGHGFGELGRFSVQYHKLFGEKPSATLRRAPDARQPPSRA